MALSRYFLVALALFLVASLGTEKVFAQFGFPGLESSVLINVDPARPAPGEVVRLSTQSIFLDLSTMRVTWKVNGEVIADGVGVTEAEFTVGPLGSAYEVVMSAYSDTNTAYSSVSIVPTEIDVLYEATTLVPPFFKGRALPSERSEVRLQAIARFKRPNGSYIQNDAISYSWWKNGFLINSVSGKGKSSVVIPSPVLFGADEISVVASAENNTYVASSMITIPSVDPILLLYQDHPLFGLQLHRALSSGNGILEREMTFAAIPFYAPVPSANDRSLTYQWSVDNRPIEQDDRVRNALTINTGDQDMETVIDLRVTHSGNAFFEVAGQWLISFSRTGGGNGSGGVNPFSQQR